MQDLAFHIPVGSDPDLPVGVFLGLVLLRVLYS